MTHCKRLIGTNAYKFAGRAVDATHAADPLNAELGSSRSRPSTGAQGAGDIFARHTLQLSPPGGHTLRAPDNS